MKDFIFFSRPRLIIFLLVLVCLFTLITPVVFAQNQEASFSFTSRFPVSGKTVLDGYIVATTETGFAVTTQAYQQNQAGVVTERPAIEVTTDGEDETTYPIATTGTAVVWVSLSNGEIKKGDAITSSPWEGVGMKATSSGPVLGVALSDVVTPEGDAEIDQVITKVRIALNPTNSYKIAGATDEGANSDRTINSTSNIRYVIGAAVIIITIYISLNFFGKLSRSGVEAIGRNPLAFKKIEFGIIINVVVGFLIAILGIAVAIYLVN
jgi:uncharacterized membrane protein